MFGGTVRCSTRGYRICHVLPSNQTVAGAVIETLPLLISCYHHFLPLMSKRVYSSASE